ncbi:hypothetical protein BGX38DRAFT_1273868 [Terfezia claveryi]|nr:hypothetical protein BGX38DRAFT_1273868 [Terfezia claveryi]
MTKEAGCWFNLQMKMRETWLKSISVTQREAEDRCKLPEEPFLIYYFQKLQMLAMAFPESKEATHIARIRAKFNNAQADCYIREQDSLSYFASEIRQTCNTTTPKVQAVAPNNRLGGTKVWIETLESDSDSDNNSMAWSIQAGEDETEANSGKV